MKLPARTSTVAVPVALVTNRLPPSTCTVPVMFDTQSPTTTLEYTSITPLLIVTVPWPANVPSLSLIFTLFARKMLPPLPACGRARAKPLLVGASVNCPTPVTPTMINPLGADNSPPAIATMPVDSDTSPMRKLVVLLNNVIVPPATVRVPRLCGLAQLQPVASTMSRATTRPLDTVMCPLALPDGPISQPSVMVVLLTRSRPPVSHASPRVSGKQPRQKSVMPLPVTVTTPVAMVICPCENESKPNTMALAVHVPLETSTWPRPVWPTYVVPFVVRIEPPPRNVIRPLTNGLAPSSESTCNRELLMSRNPPVSTTNEFRMRSGVALPAVARRSVLVELPGADN